MLRNTADATRANVPWGTAVGWESRFQTIECLGLGSGDDIRSQQNAIHGGYYRMQPSEVYPPS